VGFFLNKKTPMNISTKKLANTGKQQWSTLIENSNGNRRCKPTAAAVSTC